VKPLLRLYGIANCDTVKRARAFLAEQGATVEFHDFKKQGVPPERLDAWLASACGARLLNRQGTTWRRLGEAEQAAAGDAAGDAAGHAAGARALMLAQPSVIKRPVVEWPSGEVSVGFDADAFRQRLR